jgi:16S rRNA (cytosine967-C5)-methyltransferase
MIHRTRATAALILAEILTGKGSLSAALDPHRERSDYQLLQEMCFGCCRWFHQLDFLLEQLLSKPFKKKDQDLRSLLVLGLYQLKFMRIPDHAAINETVSATGELNKRWARGLSNAVLRNYRRREAELLQNLQLADLAQRESHPDWLVSALTGSWPEQFEEILTANNRRPPLTVRVNLSRHSREQYMDKLGRAGLQTRPGQLAPSAIYFDHAVPVSNIPGFFDGEASVQDEASQLVPELLQLTPGLRVLDACAAPGGKTCHILESEDSLTSCVALDRSPARLTKIADNLNRLQLQASLLLADGADTDVWWNEEAFDRILLDAPCSASGVIRRHPDIKLLLTPAQVEKLVVEQRRLLHALWACLKPGGLLLYTTCSVLPQENQAQIHRFLGEHADAKYEGITADWGVECESGRQLLPRADGGTDGFFFSLLRKLRKL